MRAISVQQPGAWAIARGHKTIENRGWATDYRGPVLIHASMRVDLTAGDAPLARDAGWDPHDLLATMGAIVAIAELADVCSRAVQTASGPEAPAAADTATCGCGPWAEQSQHHWRLTGICPLPRPIVALGRQDVWEPLPALVTEVRAMLAADAQVSP